MDKKRRQTLRFIFTLTLLSFMTLPFLCLTSFSQPLLDRFPKDVVLSPLPKLLDFGRGKCIPCKAMAPILKELSEEYKDRVLIKIIEIDHEPRVTDANGIRLIPTQIFFDAKNQEVFRHQGFMSKEEVKKVFQKMGIQ
jgi:thioredoxin 1